MQADDAGNDGVALERERPRAGRDVDLAVGADGGDPPVPDEDRPARGGGAPGPVDHLHAGQRDHRVVDVDELAHPVGQRRCGLRGDGKRNRENDGRDDQSAHG